MHSNSMASSQAVLRVDHVSVESSTGEKLTDCQLVLTQTEICCVVGTVPRLSIPLTTMKSIDIHQPIFGANYITGEFLEHGNSHTVTMTFSKGGATDFARAFFRVTEGRLVTEPEQQRHQSAGPSPEQDKKNK